MKATTIILSVIVVILLFVIYKMNIKKSASPLSTAPADGSACTTNTTPAVSGIISNGVCVAKPIQNPNSESTLEDIANALKKVKTFTIEATI